MNEFKPKVWMTCPVCGKPSPMPDPDAREWKGLTAEDHDDIEKWVAFKEEGSGPIPVGKLAAYIDDKLRQKNA